MDLNSRLMLTDGRTENRITISRAMPGAGATKMFSRHIAAI